MSHLSNWQTASEYHYAASGGLLTGFSFSSGDDVYDVATDGTQCQKTILIFGASLGML
nr:hypothetical protein [Superficieibacter sp. 1612_C1]